MREPDAATIYSTVSTYVVAVLVLLVAGLCAVARDLIRLTTTPQFHQAANVTPWIALGVMFQGLYLVGSIGIVITKRTTRYPIATGLAAAASLAANWVLIPRYGVLGAAWANAIAYATLAAVTVGFSLHLYPIRYEYGRLLRIAAAGAVAYLIPVVLLPHVRLPLVGIVMNGVTVVIGYGIALFATGFFHPGEIRALQDIRRRALQRAPVQIADPAPAGVEMAGELVDVSSEPATLPTDAGPPLETVNEGSRDPRY